MGKSTRSLFGAYPSLFQFSQELLPLVLSYSSNKKIYKESEEACYEKVAQIFGTRRIPPYDPEFYYYDLIKLIGKGFDDPRNRMLREVISLANYEVEDYLPFVDFALKGLFLEKRLHFGLYLSMIIRMRSSSLLGFLEVLLKYSPPQEKNPIGEHLPDIYLIFSVYKEEKDSEKRKSMLRSDLPFALKALEALIKAGGVYELPTHSEDIQYALNDLENTMDYLDKHPNELVEQFTQERIGELM